MIYHTITDDCPRCGKPLSLTTETGWIDEETVTAVLCCPSCRTEHGWSDNAVIIAHDHNTETALADVLDQRATLLAALAAGRRTGPAQREES